MRSEQVETNLQCNQNCLCCVARRPFDDPSFIARDAVARRIALAVGRGPVELVLTGGEPTLRPSLPAYVVLAKKLGAQRVVVETNATRIGPAQADALARAGVDLVRVNLSMVEDSWDEVTRDPGGTKATLRGIRSLLDRGVFVQIAALGIRSTIKALPRLPLGLHSMFSNGLYGIRLAIPVASPDPTELLGPEEAASLIFEVSRQARAIPIPLELDPRAHPPPCVSSDARSVAHIFSLSPSGSNSPSHARVAACCLCAVADRCPGFARSTLERFGEPRVEPVTDDRLRRRLTMISSVQEQIERELVEPSQGWVEGRSVPEHIIRTNFHCNQDCSFCFVSTHLPQPPLSRVLAAIDDAVARRARVVLSGGEPTLHPEILRIVRHAKALSGLAVQLQTNAIRCADTDLADQLAAAGLDEVFVSLHGATAATSDAVTRAAGTFDRTVQGLDRLYGAGIRVTVNFVLCSINAREFAAVVAMSARRWPGVLVNLSFVAPATDLVPADAQTIPRLSDVLPLVAQGVAQAQSLGVEIGGFDSMCGMPLCLVPEDIRASIPWKPIPDGLSRGEFLHPPVCSTCSRRSVCHGVRRRYVELYGWDELRPLEA